MKKLMMGLLFVLIATVTFGQTSDHEREVNTTMREIRDSQNALERKVITDQLVREEAENQVNMREVNNEGKSAEPKNNSNGNDNKGGNSAPKDTQKEPRGGRW